MMYNHNVFIIYVIISRNNTFFFMNRSSLEEIWRNTVSSRKSTLGGFLRALGEIKFSTFCCFINSFRQRPSYKIPLGGIRSLCFQNSKGSPDFYYQSTPKNWCHVFNMIQQSDLLVHLWEASYCSKGLADKISNKSNDGNPTKLDTKVENPSFGDLSWCEIRVGVALVVCI